jgi:hypothetical protein
MDTVNKPFGPALNAAINLLTGNLQREMSLLLNEEAKSLGLEEGTQADIQKREWVTPDKSSNAEP